MNLTNLLSIFGVLFILLGAYAFFSPSCLHFLEKNLNFLFYIFTVLFVVGLIYFIFLNPSKPSGGINNVLTLFTVPVLVGLSARAKYSNTISKAPLYIFTISFILVSVYIWSIPTDGLGLYHLLILIFTPILVGLSVKNIYLHLANQSAIKIMKIIMIVLILAFTLGVVSIFSPTGF